MRPSDFLGERSADSALGSSPSLDEARSSGLYVSEAAARLSGALVAVVCSCFGALASVGLISTLGGTGAALGVLGTLAILGLQLGYFSRSSRRFHLGRSVAALVAMAVLTYVPIIWFGTYWTGFAGFLAASLLIALPVRMSVAPFVAVVAVSTVIGRHFGAEELDPDYATAYSLISTLITGLVIFGLTRLSQLVHELHNARNELSRMAVAEERLRFARDAHDLLGMSLSAIALKGELADRLIAAEPERAQEEVREMLAISRRALGEVRMLASGHMELSLADELDSARAVLTAAEIDTTTTGTDTELPSEVTTLFATLLREAVTNVLRHSKADLCVISVARSGENARLAITNDRADEAGELADEDTPHHHGIPNLQRRFAERGGTLTVHREDQEFTVAGALPLTDPSDVTTSRRPWRYGSRRRGSAR